MLDILSGAQPLMVDVRQSGSSSLQSCVAQPPVFVGTTRTVYWHDGSTFEGMLYSALLHKPPRSAVAAMERADRAVAAYNTLWGKCPYKVVMLHPPD
jgi:hypothetical protein